MNLNYKNYLEFVIDKFPIWKNTFLVNPPKENLISFQKMVMPKTILDQAQEFINIVYKLRNQKVYQEKILGKEITKPHFSVLMSFDFHSSDDGLKLIEVNTNASHALTTFSLISYMYPEQRNFIAADKQIFKSFIEEYELFCSTQPNKILICDQDVLNQKAYFEFEMYKELFIEQGLESEIADLKDLKFEDNSIFYKSTPYDFIYNRDTDFYLNNTPVLSSAYHSNRVCITPHPEEYSLLADKNRLLNWSDALFVEPFLNSNEIGIINKHLLKMKLLDEENFEEIWSLRKNYFFKPSQSFGSKAAYKGANVSRKKLEASLLEQNFVAQEYSPAPEIEVDINGNKVKAKYDLRFYVYNGTIQLAAARLYIGQTTNFQTVGLGLTPVIFE